ncbi:MULTISPECIES: SDR family NAD(P)-dependent oxidoreductase [unclassified Sphingomonas]|uniref:SDR family NAD(P)-dependent oxidoreductase n=1 Tax=unclassified Sphingomonas TaxID=196159 RepID=UPI002F9114E8
MFAREIARHCAHATIVLTGRSSVRPELEAALAQLRSPSIRVEYRIADVTSKRDVDALVRSITSDHGKLTGVIHAAGISRDDFLMRKPPDVIREVLAPKTLGIEYLDHATQGLPLDLFVAFSSVAATFGNAGQSDYATANAFLDRYVEFRAGLVARGARRGRTLSIGWPLWAEGGMGADPRLRAQLAELGMEPLQTQLGLEAFYRAAASECATMIVTLAPTAASPAGEEVGAHRGQATPYEVDLASGEGEPAELLDWLISVVRDVTLLPSHLIDPGATYDSFGLDSLMITRIHRRLVARFPDLPKTLFFEHPTLRNIRDHLKASYPELCAPKRAQGLTVSPAPAVITAPTQDTGEEIAIIGMAGTYPDAPDLDRFWANLAAGRESLREVPPDRWSLAAETCATPETARQTGKSYCRVGGFLDGFAHFDPLFFGISPTEALSMDPQERLFLQTCWHTMEDAGYTRDALRKRHGGRVGVFVGVCKTGYELHGPAMWRQGEQVHPRTSFGSIANRVSYVLDLHGPSLALDTMCSSSLTAIHYACESLIRSECALAFAGGVNLYLHPSAYATLCAAGMLSPTGACRSFGADADGFIPGEGVGAILLKRLARARADGDNIHAVIRATAVNHGGHVHGYTVPNPRAQGALVRAAIDKAGVRAQDIGYVEAHGTGTPLGDPVEIAGLAQAFAGDDAEPAICAIGSVKSNIGHLEAAAGIAGISKVVLQMKHGKIAPSLHCATPNRDIRLDGTPFRLQRELSDWGDGERRGDHAGPAMLAGVSSFGAGGANGHVIIEAHGDERTRAAGPRGTPIPIVLSARSSERLRALAGRLAAWLHARPSADDDLLDIAYTLQVGREAMRYRLGLLVMSVAELATKLAAFARDGDVAGALQGDGSAIGTTPDSQAGRTTPEALVDRLVGAGDTVGLLDLWVGGMPVDWDRIYPLAKPRRISLPGYPFAEEYYWPKAAAAPLGEAVDGVRVVFPVWRAQPRPAAAASPMIANASAAIAFGLDAPEDAGLVRHWLQPQPGATVDALADALAGCGPLDHLLLWLPARTDDSLDDELLADLQELIRPCFRTVKALLQRGYGQRPFEITVVTRGAVAAVPAELADPAHAALHGLFGALAKEQPHWRIRVVDLGDGDRPSLAEILNAPIDPEGGCMAVRQGRWLRQATLVGRPETFGAPPLPSGGVYVVVGGAGHIGTAFSERLVRDQQAQVVWIGRRPIDRTIQDTIDRLAAFGPAPIYIQADATNRQALERAYQQIRAAFGEVNGLVHATIVLSDAALTNMSETQFMAALEAKSVTAVRLAQVFGSGELDFVLFFSSMQSFGKLAGQSNYAAGCLFADAFAHRLRRLWRGTVKIINWGSWDVIDGKPISSMIAANMERAGLGLLTAGDDALAIDMLLAGPHDQFGYYRASGAALARESAHSGAPPVALPVTVPPAVAPGADVQAARSAFQASEVGTVLVAKLREALGLTTQPVSNEEPLATYGVDSITGVQFIRLVNLALRLDLDVKTIYDHPSIASLTAHILATYDQPPCTAPSAAESPAGTTAPRPSPMTAARTAVARAGAALDDAIAVVGMGARFARSTDVRALWQHLVEGTDLVAATVIPRRGEAWPPGQTCGFLDDAEMFDPRFFGIGKAEARHMDPQQRIFLEEAWHALEDAGYASKAIRGARCGVYVGHNGSDYHQLFSGDLPAQALWGNAASILSARIAYHLDLQGPAITIDTACSSSLTAIHLACQALRQGEIDIALAGGAQVYCTPSFQVAAAKAGMLSPTGRCHSFDARADGFVPAEGCGVLVLRRLADAIAARDTIYGVVRASATNQDGATNGITAPSGLSQERLQRMVFREAGVAPRDVQLVEAHGTGTTLGDPIEFGALASVFGESTGETGFCALGSIKSNLGHTLAAAGVAGAIKVLLALRNEQIPPSVHFDQQNDRIDIANSPFFVPRYAQPWPRLHDRVRLAAVSSFGFSGTNCHMLIGEAPPVPPRATSPRPWLIALSAKGAGELREAAIRLRDHVAGTSSEIADIGYTLAIGRHHFGHRLAFVVETAAELRAALQVWLDGSPMPDGFAASLSEKDMQAAADGVNRAAAAIETCRAAGTKPVDLRHALVELARLHIAGCPIDFEALFEGLEVGRVPLPGYPFRRERCWVEPAVQIALTIDAEAPHLGGHAVRGRRTLPAVASLGLVVAAFRQAEELGHDVDLSDVVWLSPIAIDAGARSLTLKVQGSGEGGWTFDARQDEGDDHICLRGRAKLRRPASDVVRIEDALRQCGHVVADQDMRDGLRPAAAEPSAPTRIVDGVALGERAVLARFGAERLVSGDAPEVGLGPAFFDAALRAWAAFGARVDGAAPATPVPFALAELRIMQWDQPPRWAWVRQSDAANADSDGLDIDFFAADGAAIASFRRLALRDAPASAAPLMRPGDRAIAEAEDPAPPAADQPVRTLTLEPCWVEVSHEAPVTAKATLVLAGSEQAAAWARADLPDARIHILSPAEPIEEIAELLEDAAGAGRIVCCPVFDPSSVEADATAAATHIFRVAKGLQRSGLARPGLELVVVTLGGAAVRPGERAMPDQAAVHGVVGCLAKECSDWRVAAVDLPSWQSATLAEILRRPTTPDGDLFVYRDGVWLRRAFVERQLAGTGAAAFREGGVYVLIGGAGALGGVLTEHLVRRYRAHVVWVGRRPLDDEIAQGIARLAGSGPPVRYVEADARDCAGLLRALDTVLHAHPFIDAVVHAALVMAGSDIAHLSEERFADVFGTKAQICRSLAQVARPGKIGQVLFFSSIQSFQRTARQANYAAGCAFKDAFADSLADLLNCPVRIVNWGYWGGVGVAARLPAFQNWLKQAGMSSIEPQDGMAFLEAFLTSPLRQAAYVKLRDGAQLRGITVIEETEMTHDYRQGSPIEALPATASPARTSAVLAEMARFPSADFERMLARLLGAELGRMGLFDRDRIDPANWPRAHGLIDLYQPWFEESLRALDRQGLIVRDQAGYRPPHSSVRADDVWAEWAERKRVWRDVPQLEPFIALVEHTLSRLPDILTGKSAATEIMFPGSSLRLVEPIYKDNAVADYFNEVLADALIALVRNRAGQDGNAGIRILEIGAGTGGTTAILLPRLEPYARSIAEYRYTDLSKAFLLHGERAYGPGAPYFRTAIFDAEQSPEAQDMPTGHFDVVIAANVLHATRSIRHTLRNVQACLKPGGLLLLNEMSANSLFSHLTFGLLKGWWLSEDPDLRVEGSPVVSQQNWATAMRETGFGTMLFPTEQVRHLGQQIVVAEKEAGTDRSMASLRVPVAEPVLSAEPRPAANLEMREEVRLVVLAELGRTLDLDSRDIDPDVSFADYGLDSILAIATVDALNDRLDLELTSTSLFEQSSVNLLIEAIMRELADRRSAARGDVLPSVAQVPEAPAASAHPWAAELEAPPPPPALVPHKPLDAQATVASPASASKQPHQRAAEPIAIIGASGRYGSANSLSELWASLSNGEERIEPVTRWDLAESYGVPAGAPDHCWHGSFLTDIDCFDPSFFNISAIEATFMDPQQRLFLEESWTALEDAGYAGPAIEGRRCGVYAGQNGEDYRGFCRGEVPAQAMWGNAAAILSARIAYYLNLKGPAITIDTACSSSLVAVHLACQALRLGEVDMAIAGGVAVRCTPEFYQATATTKMVSTSGHCRPFDARADGFIPGEGVGAIVLKRFSDAVADGDHIHALIRSSCLNQDGTTNGITAPSVGSQEALHLAAFELAAITPDQLQLVEAHGTGTRLGDPIEHEALTRAFRRYTDRTGFCALGSVKANVGHTTAAAGMASIAKVILALDHHEIPPAPNFSAPNPLLDLDSSPFFVNTRPLEWVKPADGPRRAAISSFGISGTNAHLIVEEAPQRPAAHHVAPSYLVVLSAHSEPQLTEMLSALVRRCSENPSLNCADVSFTLLTGRKHLPHRLALIVRDTAHLAEAGRQYAQFGEAADIYRSASVPKRPEQASLLTAFGNRCIQDCADGAIGTEYTARLRTVAELFVQGYQLEFSALFPAGTGRRVSLPTYPFARERYWATDAVAPDASRRAPEHPSVVLPRDEGAAASAYRQALEVISAFFLEDVRVPKARLRHDEELRAYGMDSLIGMRLLGRLETAFGVSIANSELIELPTIAALAKAVADRIDAGASSGDATEAPGLSDAERRATEILTQYERGELDLVAAEAMLVEIALAA